MSNQSIDFNSTDLGGASYSLTVTKREESYLPQVTLDLQRIPGRHGAIVQGAFLAERRLSLPVIVDGTSASDVRSKLDEIAYVLYQASSAALTFDDITDRYWNVRLEGLGAFEWLGLQAVRCVVDFVAADPLAFDNTEIDTTVALTDPDTITITSGTLADGTADIYPVYIIKNTGAATGTITFANAASSETLTWASSLATNNYLKIDVENHRCLTSADDVTYTDSMTGKSGIFPILKPRVNNALTITGVAGTLRRIYRERYLN